MNRQVEKELNHMFYIKQKLLNGGLNINEESRMCGISMYLHSTGRKFNRNSKEEFFKW